MLTIRLLGTLEARDGELILTPTRKKQRALLAALAVRAGEAVSTDRLVDDLWGERAPKTARHALENYVSDLRKTLGPDAIATKPGGYALEVDPEQVDLLQFERLASETRGGTAEVRAERLREALALLRGPPLGDLAFEPFASPIVARFEELELRAREELVEAELELGRHAEVVAELESLVAAHPYRERLRAQLMLALYRSGRQAEALTAYQDARRVLVEELGIDPGEELQVLERAILRQDQSLRAPPSVPPRAPPEPVETAPRRPARKTVTVLVVELGNAAALAEALDPEPLRAILDRYSDLARSAIARYGGTHAKLAGEAVLAVFGVPAAQEDDAERALHAAAEIREGIGTLNDGLLPEHGVFLELRSGICTGEVLVRPDGEDLATGRAVATAEELARLARPGQILVADASYALVRDAVVAEELELAPDLEEPVFRLVELRPDQYGRTLRLEASLVGRRRQLAALAGAFESAAANRSAYLFSLLGPAGVGKSRLVREFVDGVGEIALVLQGRCLPYGETVTYWPVREALRGAGLGEPDLGTDAAAAVQSVLEGLALERPLVVVLDDLQWGEPALLDLVEELAASSRVAPILLLCLARPELLEERPTWAGGVPNASSLLLEPLTEAESERLLDNLLGESELPDSIRDYLVRTAGGNPLFLEELLATLVDRDVLQYEAGRWTTTEVQAIPLPPTVQALIAARIDRLPEGERAVLELASVDGKRDFHRAAVVELASGELLAEVDAHLLGLVRKELVRPQPSEEGNFAFRHQLIRDAAYASIPKQARSELHERLADFIDRSRPAGVDVEELAAYHRDLTQHYRSEVGSIDGLST